MTEQKGSVKTFSCPSCGGSVNVRAAGISISAVCGSCGSIIDVNNDNFTIIREAAVKTRAIPIELGRRATFFGIVWEVIGYCERCDDSEMYEWREYLLFNPYQGFRFLTEANGHWNFVTMLREDIQAADDVARYKNEYYRPYLRGGAKVIYVMGEFFWRVRVGENTVVADYIAPPYMLSMERSQQDIVWSRAVYIDEETVEKAFGLPAIKFAKQNGVAPNQPSHYHARLKRCAIPFSLAFILIAIVQMIFVSLAANEIVYENSFNITTPVRGQTVIAEPMEIKGESSNLEFTVTSPVNNNWLELNMSLVNDATQESDTFLHMVEYYYGTDSDGAWREGGQTSTTMLSAVTAGKYHLLIEPDSGIWPPPAFKVRVTRDVPVWGLFLLALGCVAIYPAWLALRHGAFERRRWADSDCAPMLYRRADSSDSGDDD